MLMTWSAGFGDAGCRHLSTYKLGTTFCKTITYHNCALSLHETQYKT
jgi:hypothetical protein